MRSAVFLCVDSEVSLEIDPSVHRPIYFSFCGEDSIAGPSGDLVGMPGGME